MSDIRILACSLLLLVIFQTSAEPSENYKLYCQGCHVANGMGGSGVPPLTNVVGYFLNTKEGRAFLIQVPGVAYSQLDDAAIANVTNWMITQFAGMSEPASWDAYTEEEVAVYRKNPLREITKTRVRVFLESFSKSLQ